MIKAKLGHGRHGELALGVGAGLKKFQRHGIVGITGQAGDGRSDGGEGHGMVGLEIDEFALEPLGAVEFAVGVAWRMAVAAEADLFNEVAAVFYDRRVGGGRVGVSGDERGRG